MIPFSKYHGTGNDFILIDDCAGIYPLSKEAVASLCHRRFGVGADGLILLRAGAGAARFHMAYYNSDGAPGSMCGNGGRCAMAFAAFLRIIVQGEVVDFTAPDGPHTAVLDADGTVRLSMRDVTKIEHLDGYSLADTGSPHFVQFVEDADGRDVRAEGRAIRHWTEFEPGGVNVNFVQAESADLYVRTYERGVEEETWSCGTGAVAAAVVASGDAVGDFEVKVRTRGGWLTVAFTKDTPTSARAVVLSGPAVLVYSGTCEP